jgi:flagellar L-ring protein precursor FlgH
VLLAGGCTRRRPGPSPPIDTAEIGHPPPALGSLWRPELAANYPFVDVRARFPGDVLTVVVSEESEGRKDASTDGKAESSISASVEDFFGIPASSVRVLPAGFNPESIVKAASARESTAEAETSRAGSLEARITVTVEEVEPNGNLRVAGEKVITVNREAQHIVLSGLVRPEDIGADNTVLSSRLADARIEYWGRGVVGDKTGVPIAHRLYDWIWPF